MHQRSESNQLMVYRGARQEPAERRISYFELGCEVNGCTVAINMKRDSQVKKIWSRGAPCRDHHQAGFSHDIVARIQQRVHHPPPHTIVIRIDHNL